MSSSNPNRPDSLISAQSPEQRALLAYCTNKQIHNDQINNTQCTKPTIYLDGPHYVWFRNLQVSGVDVLRINIINNIQSIFVL